MIDQPSATRLSRFRLVVFDMDDTLYPEVDYVRSGYRAVSSHIAEVTGLAAGPLFERMWGHFRCGDRRRVFDAILAEFDLTGRFSPPSLVEVYRSHPPRITLPGQTREVLVQLRRMGCRLAVVSDGPLAMQQRKAQALGLIDLVDSLVLTDELPPGCAKPSPAAFAGLMRRFDFPPAACVYVADNPSKDFLGPRQLGWYTIQFVRDEGIYTSEAAPPGGEPHMRIDDLRDLL